MEKEMEKKKEMSGIKDYSLTNFANALNVIYEDNHIIVVEKFVNVASQSDDSEDISMLDIVKRYIKVKYNKPNNVYLGLVHRLDRPTGGIMVFAKTSKAASRLSEQIRVKNFEKKYLAVVDGEVTNQDEVELVNYLKKDQRNNISKIVNENAKEAKKAVLSYKSLGYAPKQDLSLIEVKLKTGRHHQIRVQMANIGHSLFGDQKYGNRGKGKQICLFAYYLSFKHPTKDEQMTFKLLPDETQPGFANFDYIIEELKR